MAMILDALGSKVTELAFDLVKEEVGMLLGVPGEIEKLHSTLQQLRRILVHAEKRRAEDGSLDQLLGQLKDVMYDAEDILDDCSIVAATKSSSSSSSPARCGFSIPDVLSCCRKPRFTHKIGKSIIALNSNLERIWVEMGRFKLVHDLTTPPAVAGGADWHNMHIGAKNHNRGSSSSSSSSVVESDLVGTKIIESTNKIIELSTYKPAAGGQESAMANQLLVFAIVGIGGIGKTTLAQNIFADHDHKIEENFEIKMWVSVGREYSPVSVLRNVLTEAKVSHGGADTGLEAMVEGAVRGKKYFLVLDDVWDARIWDEYLRNPLRSGAAGSRVLISTRNDEVAMRMKAVRPYHRVDLLSPEDGWSLLCKKVLSPGEEEEELSGCKDIGIQIVDKCEGLPLAIKTLGGVLCGKRRPRDWELVLENMAWSVTGLPDGINNALYLSYLDLPSHLRQCFLYCSLLPKDHLIHREPTASLWIAEGFVNAPQGLSMEETAEGYFRELVSRSLLQPNDRWYDQASCQMHDLLISLGQHLAQDESLVLGKVQGLGTTITGPVKLRRLSVVTGDVEAIANFLPNPESLRSLLMFINFTHLDQYLSNHLDHLRVLDLSGTKVTELPEDFLCKQLHLRYLNLSETSIRKIPESIGKLMNLQFLLLRACEELHDLPKGILGLHNLRRLDVVGTMVEGMPAGIGRLQHLNVLLGFVLHQNATGGWSNLGELQHLSHLRALSIYRLERASNGVEARAAGLVNKHRLSELDLNCTPPLAGGEQSTEDIARIEDVFEELQPPPSLDLLEVHGYFGRRLPNWLMSVSSPVTLVLPYIRRLVLEGCGYLERLPPLGELPHLDYLWIEGATAVKTIGPEFLGVSGGGASFPKLETLYIKGMANWEEWQWDNSAQSMHCLRHLSLVACPHLRFLPEGLLRWATALTHLRISANSKLEAVENIFSLQELVLQYCYSLKRVSNLPALKRLALVDDRMDSLPDWLSEGVHKAKPEKLEIWCNDELMKKICLLREKGKEWSKIQHINRVEIHNMSRSLHAYYTKTPYSFTTNLNNIGNADPQEPSTSSTDGGASH